MTLKQDLAFRKRRANADVGNGIKCQTQTLKA